MPEQKNLILIGGNGFIGKAFKLFLQQYNYNIIVIGRKKLDGQNENYYSINNIDLKKPDTFLDTSAENIIVDFAYTSIPNTSFENPVKDFSENLLNIIQYLDFAKTINAKKYIYISSGGTVYGNQGSKVLKEDGANFPIAPYGITKLACERYVHMYCEVHQVPGIIVRPSNVYGPGQMPFCGQGIVATVMASIYKNDPVLMYGNGTTVRDYIYIEDLTEALMDVIKHGEMGEIYNIGSGIGVTTNEMLEKIVAVTLPLEISKRNIKPIRPFDIKHNVLDYSKINKLTNWKPKTELSVGLRETWKWVQHHMQSQVNEMDLTHAPL